MKKVEISRALFLSFYTDIPYFSYFFLQLTLFTNSFAFLTLFPFALHGTCLIFLQILLN